MKESIRFSIQGAAIGLIITAAIYSALHGLEYGPLLTNFVVFFGTMIGALYGVFCAKIPKIERRGFLLQGIYALIGCFIYYLLSHLFELALNTSSANELTLIRRFISAILGCLTWMPLCFWWSRNRRTSANINAEKPPV